MKKRIIEKRKIERKKKGDLFWGFLLVFQGLGGLGRVKMFFMFLF